MARSGQFLGRNPLLSKGINKIGLALAGCLYFANIHFSAIAIREIAARGGGGLIPPALAQPGLTTTFGRYVVALSVSLIATIMLGVLLHPSGLGSFIEEVRSIRGAKASRTMGALVVTIAAMLILTVGFALYTYDFYTTCAAFGLPLSALFSLAAVPVWVNVLGPEILFYGTNMYGFLISGGSNAAAPSGKPGPKSMPAPGMFNLKR